MASLTYMLAEVAASGRMFSDQRAYWFDTAAQHVGVLLAL
jgi:hypothetical protein